MTRRQITLHGHRVSYQTAGRGPFLVLLHGIAGTSTTWEEVIPLLCERHTVVAPDLIGHGESDRPRGDYSLGAYATGLRDLLEALGQNRATIVGHSLGGGIAMQFAFQFPERCERLVLVSSGGLGREVHLLLRAAALPGAAVALPWLSVAGKQGVGKIVHALGMMGLRASADLEETWRSFVSLADPEACRAFLHTVRGLIDLGGQRVSASDRLYLAAALPTLIVWGGQDRLIPVEHARAAHTAIPGSRLEVFPGAGHFPHRDDPAHFAEVLLDFLRTTRPFPADPKRWRTRLRAGPPATPCRGRTSSGS
jgi:pimeloyl-ACP methyl ester carboxylesterase